MWNIRFVAFISGVLGVFLFSSVAAGNGVYMPERAYAAMPKIPTQRAMIVYRDGVETLVVESAMDTESPNVGWILPLPAEPTKLDVADGGMLTTLAVCTGPVITHDLYDLYWPALLLLGLLLPIFIKAVVSKKGITLLGVLGWIVIYGLFVMLFAPAVMHAGLDAGAAGGVEVRSTQRIGNYDVAVLRAKDAQALSKWLDENSLRPLDEKAQRLVDDYIGRDWCFVVASLAREKGGEATPHPISATFPIDTPVYPMKLTSLADSTTHVELHVIAGKMAEADGFHRAASHVYHPMKEREGYGTLLRRYPGRMPLAIGQPDLCEFLWDGCVVTRLQADLGPEAMDRDVELELVEFRPHRDHFFSERGRREVVLLSLLWGAIPLLFVCTVACYKRRRPGKRGARIVAMVAVGLFALAVGLYVSLPVIPVGQGVTSGDIWNRQNVFQGVARAMVGSGRLHSAMTAEEIAEFPKKAVELKFIGPEYVANPFTGQPVRYERSPGNFSTRRVGDEIYFCLYDRYGREVRVVALPPPPKSAVGVGDKEVE